ncbi:MAG: transpeptidase family protein [Bacteroidales bacterium]|nr:transpeptidase family protein [Bacteroidales bacterium]
MKNVRSDILKRVFLVYGLMLLMGLAIIVKMIYIQVKEGAELLDKTHELNLKYFDVHAVRGNIYASDGSLLVTSVPVFEIRMDVACPNISDKFFNDNVRALSVELSRLFRDKPAGVYEKELRKERKAGNRYYLVKNRVSYYEYKKLRDFPIFERGMYKGGLIAVPDSKREKPYRLLAERTLGYETEDGSARVGLEGAYSDLLSGKNGRQLKKKINNGDWRPVFDENEVEPQNGKDIITTIDVNLQDVAEDALYRHLVEHKAEWGCAVLMEVNTGYVKAIANLKLDEKSGNYYESFNYAVGESIEPGSTFKLASVLSLFEDGLADLQDSVNVKYGVTRFSNLEIKDVHYFANDWITVREAFEASSNVGISQIVNQAYSDHPERFVNRLRQMGIDRPLNIEIPGEATPYLKNTKDKEWSKVSLPFMSIGYEVMLTPLQVLAFYNAVANDGVMVKPVFVNEIKYANQTIERIEPEVISKSIGSEKALSDARSLLEGVVLRGTAKNLSNSVYKIAGKTGTAQIARKNQGYDKENYNASFVGYFPADNPKYSCIVVVSRPSTGRYYASSVAVPVFKEIADKVYANSYDIHEIKPDAVQNADYPQWMIGNRSDLEFLHKSLNIPLDTAGAGSQWVVTVKTESDQIRLQSRTVQEGVVPNLKGMGARDALFILESLGLKVTLEGKGFVRDQTLPPGRKISRGEGIKILLEV